MGLIRKGTMHRIGSTALTLAGAVALLAACASTPTAREAAPGTELDSVEFEIVNASDQSFTLEATSEDPAAWTGVAPDDASPIGFTGAALDAGATLRRSFILPPDLSGTTFGLRFDNAGTWVRLEQKTSDPMAGWGLANGASECRTDTVVRHGHEITVECRQGSTDANTVITVR